MILPTDASARQNAYGTSYGVVLVALATIVIGACSQHDSTSSGSSSAQSKAETSESVPAESAMAPAEEQVAWQIQGCTRGGCNLHIEPSAGLGDWSQVVTREGQQRQTVGHHLAGSGPLSHDIRTKMDRQNVCTGCHQNIPIRKSPKNPRRC